MDDEYFESPLKKGVPYEVPIYLEVLGTVNGMTFKEEDLEKKLAGMTDKSLAQSAIEYGKNIGVIELDPVKGTYRVDFSLAYSNYNNENDDE